MKKITALCCMVLYTCALWAAPLGDYQFKSPAFNGVGYSSHVLTIENQEFTRQKAARDAIQAAIDKKIADDKNTNLSKFMNNLESRIYAQISQNVATAMFANGACKSDGTGACTGNIDFQGNYISWGRVKSADDANCPVAYGACIMLKVADPTATNPTTAGCNDPGMSCIYVPLNSFSMPGN
jgi:Type VIII secretion system (T8SS), CsgF protein